MIAFDTTVLIDAFRAKGNPAAPVTKALMLVSGERFVVPLVAAGEYIAGGASISGERLAEAIAHVARHEVILPDMQAALVYARIYADLRARKLLTTDIHNDLWIAATAISRGARLLTRNPAHFADIPGLVVVGYT
jgi:predicted nucleic acid-binding protein